MSNRLTAMDIEKQTFTTKMRGWDPEQVRMYLQSVAEEVERLQFDNDELKDKVTKLERERDEFRTREATLQQTLVTAQKMTDELKEKTRGQCALMLQEARLKSDRLLHESQNTLTQLETEISRRRLERDLFEKRLRLTIDEHLSLLEDRAASGRHNESPKPERDNVHKLHPRTSEAG